MIPTHNFPSLNNSLLIMKQAMQLGTLSAMSIGIAFLFQWYVLAKLGPGIETDALFAGMTIPQLVLAVISGSLMHVLVPIFAGESEDRLRHDAWGLLVLVGGLFSFLAIALYVSAPWWIPLTVPGFSKVNQALTVNLTRIQLIGMVFTAVNGVQWAAYHARQQFVWAEFTPILSNILALLVLIWALPKYGVVAAAWISTLRMALQTLLLAPGMGRPVRVNLESVAIQQTWQRIKPLLLGNLYFKTDALVDRFLLSTVDSGSLSLYYLAQQLYGAVNQVINKAICAPLVPLLSKLYKAGNTESFRSNYYRKLLQIGTISIFGFFTLVLFGHAMLSLLIGYGNIGSDNIAKLWWIMICLGGVFVGGAVSQVCVSSFYACGDTATPMKIAVITHTLYIFCKVVAFYFFGAMGLALTTSIYFMTNLLVQLYFFRKIFL